MMRCIASYKPCLKAFPRQIYSLLAHYIKKQIQLICSSKERKSETLAHLKCFHGTDRDLLEGFINGFSTIYTNIRSVIIRDTNMYH